MDGLTLHRPTNDNRTRDALSRWHEEEAERAEREAERTDSPGRRIRLLNAARMHRDCAGLALMEG